VSWTKQTSGTLGNLYGVTSNSSMIVAVGAGSIILTSPTGTGWTPRTSQGGNYRGIIWSGTQFLIVGDYNYGNMRTSFDGITWTAQGGAVGGTMYGAAWSGTDFVAIGGHGGIGSSPDGVAWTSETSPVSTDLYGIVWFNNQFIVVGLFGDILTGN